MPGFGINDDELSKLFAEAGEAVKKVAGAPSAPPPPPVPTPAAEPAPPVAAAPAPPQQPRGLAWDEEPPARGTAWNEEPRALAWDEEPGGAESPAAAYVAPAPAPRPAGPAGPQTRLVGGEQADDALLGKTAEGGSVRLPWAQIRALSAGRVGERMLLALKHDGKIYYFVDDAVTYKGFLRTMASTLAMNWRGLVGELVERVADKSDPGVQALTGGGGMVPRYVDNAEFFGKVSSRA